MTISINLPISLFGDMPLDQVISSIHNMDALVQENARLKERVNQSLSTAQTFAGHLDQILNSDDELYVKFSGLRELSSATKQQIQMLGSNV